MTITAKHTVIQLIHLRKENYFPLTFLYIDDDFLQLHILDNLGIMINMINIYYDKHEKIIFFYA